MTKETTRIAKLKIRKLKMAELLAFCEHALIILTPLSLKTPIFGEFVDKTQELRRHCDEQKAIKASFLFEADENLCRASRAFRTMVLACSLHPREEMRKAAELVSQKLPEIVNPKRLTHDDMFTRSKLVFEALNSIPENIIDQIYLKEYAEQFKIALTNFIDAYQHRQKVYTEHISRDGMNLMRTLINLANDLFQYLQLIYQYDMPETGKRIIEDLSAYINAVNDTTPNN